MYDLAYVQFLLIFIFFPILCFLDFSVKLSICYANCLGSLLYICINKILCVLRDTEREREISAWVQERGHADPSLAAVQLILTLNF